MDRFSYRRSAAAAAALASLAILSACADDDGTLASTGPTGELDLVPGSDVTVDGVVVANSVDPCLLPDHDDGCVMGLGGILTVDADGHEVSVHYGGSEWPPCDNPPAISQGESARVGMRVTVYAEVTDDDHVSGADLDTCGSDEYHIDTAS
jgi:hypothetical protein